jgi:signal transduction histidine kinase
MVSKPSTEKIKPFRLVKYFTFTSLIVVFVGAIILTVLNTHWMRSINRAKSEDYALLLIENLNHQVFLQFIVPVALKFGKIQLRNEDQYEHLDKVVHSTFHSFKVDTVNIYDMKNTISYSFDKELIGKKDLGGAGYQRALEGAATSKIVQRGNFWEIFLGFPKEIRMVTFAPLRAERPLSTISGPVLGVVEIVQDLSADYKNIFHFQMRVVFTCVLVMGVIFFFLRLMVKRGESIIERRSQERLKLEEKLSRAKRLSSLGEMTAGISHEIRNPLGIIRSSAELLKKKMAQLAPHNKIPDMIVEESGRMNDIITDFLNYARPRSPDLTECRVEEILQKNLSFLASQAQEEGYIFKTFFADDLPPILGDTDMLYQAFLNVLINAMQAMPTGGEIELEVSADDEFISIIFQDEGIGISDEEKEKIWNPFFTTKDKGTGLGMGIVKNIIESHGGNIKIENNAPLRGVSVLIQLPV